jgi:hypothetical protein
MHTGTVNHAERRGLASASKRMNSEFLLLRLFYVCTCTIHQRPTYRQKDVATGDGAIVAANRTPSDCYFVLFCK